MQCIMIIKYFWIFLNKNEILKQKNDSTTPRLCKHNHAALKQSTKVKELMALIPKQKIENAMTRALFKKRIFTLKKTSLVRNKGVYRL